MLMVSIIGEDFAALSLAVSIALCDEKRTASDFTLGIGSRLHLLEITSSLITQINRERMHRYHF